MRQIFLLIFVFGQHVDAQRDCFVCKSSAIVSYWDYFFNRRLMSGKNEIMSAQDCDTPVSRFCAGACYTINVTSVHVHTEQIVVFGIARGCTTGLFPSRYSSNTCERRDIELRRIQYPVHAKYCFCTGDMCNGYQDPAPRSAAKAGQVADAEIGRFDENSQSKEIERYSEQGHYRPLIDGFFASSADDCRKYLHFQSTTISLTIMTGFFLSS